MRLVIWCTTVDDFLNYSVVWRKWYRTIAMVFGFYNSRRENQAVVVEYIVLHKHLEAAPSQKQQQQLRNWDVTADWHAMAIIRDALVQPPYFSSFRFLMAPGEFPAVFPDKRPLSGHLILDNSIPLPTRYSYYIDIYLLPSKGRIFRDTLVAKTSLQCVVLYLFPIGWVPKIALFRFYCE